LESLEHPESKEKCPVPKLRQGWNFGGSSAECQSCCPLDGSSEAGQMVRGYPPVSSNVAGKTPWPGDFGI